MKTDISRPPKSIIISGASSGIGRALAIQYANKGIMLGLIARNEARLEEVKRLCIEKGADVEILSCDIRNYKDIENWVLKFDQQYSVDLIISNAGISGGTGDNDALETLENLRTIYETNVFAAIHLGQCLYKNFQQRGYGQIAFTGSIAGFQGWSGAPAYTSSKSALHTYAESLRLLGEPHGIQINIIAPGFVKSAMTDKNDFPMPFKVTAEHAAQIIEKGLKKNKRYIIFPKRMYLLSLIARILPEFALSYISRRTKGKSNINNECCN